MIRRLIILVCICLLSIISIDRVALAQSSQTPKFTEKQLREGDKIAKKALQEIEKGHFSQAEAYWTQLIDKFPDNPAVWSNRGNTRIAQGRFDEAIADFNQSIKIAPQYPDPYLNRGIAYEGQQLWQAALDDYNQVLAINPNDAVAYNNRGNAKAGQQLWQEALADYQKAVEIEPNFVLARTNVALVSYQLGDRTAAIRDLRNLVRKYPMFSDLRAALTVALWVEGLQGEAESNWVAAVGLDDRYQELDWVRNTRRWPPEMVKALEKFLTLS